VTKPIDQAAHAGLSSVVLTSEDEEEGLPKRTRSNETTHAKGLSNGVEFPTRCKFTSIGLRRPETEKIVRIPR